jgi:hypothetical protein
LWTKYNDMLYSAFALQLKFLESVRETKQTWETVTSKYHLWCTTNTQHV